MTDMFRMIVYAIVPHLAIELCGRKFMAPALTLNLPQTPTTFICNAMQFKAL